MKVLIDWNVSGTLEVDIATDCPTTAKEHAESFLHYNHTPDQLIPMLNWQTLEIHTMEIDT